MRTPQFTAEASLTTTPSQVYRSPRVSISPPSGSAVVPAIVEVNGKYFPGNYVSFCDPFGCIPCCLGVGCGDYGEWPYY
jgi:hypothetical protein